MIDPNRQRNFAEGMATFLTAATIGAYAVKLLFKKRQEHYLSGDITPRDRLSLQANSIDPDRLYEPDLASESS